MGYQVCGHDATWSQALCDEGYICQEADGTVLCINPEPCEPGGTRCLEEVGTGRQICSENMVWLNDPCDEGHVCTSVGVEAICIQQVCNEGEAECGVTSQEIRYCSAQGLWIRDVCDPGETCWEGREGTTGEAKCISEEKCTTSFCSQDLRKVHTCSPEHEHIEIPCSMNEFCTEIVHGPECIPSEYGLHPVVSELPLHSQTTLEFLLGAKHSKVLDFAILVEGACTVDKDTYSLPAGKQRFFIEVSSLATVGECFVTVKSESADMLSEAEVIVKTPVGGGGV